MNPVMQQPRREWYDPIRWPARLRWALLAPLALGAGAFVVIVYGTFNQLTGWGPPFLMHSVLAACASVALIVTAAYVAPACKRFAAAAFALVPLTLAVAKIPLDGYLRAGPMISAGYGIGLVLGLFVAFTFRSDEEALRRPRRPSPYPRSFPFRPR
jgi:hypothetical protein